MARNSLLKDPYFRLCNFFFVEKQSKGIILDPEKPEGAVKEATKALKKGSVVGIYPEGGRSYDGKLQKGKTGMIRLALSAKVPIVPLGIEGTYELMPRGKSVPKIKKNIIINIGKPIYFDQYYNKKITKKMLRKLTDDVMKQIAKSSSQTYKY